MTMKVVVVDGARLPESVEFPPLETEKFSWEQYPDLNGAEIMDRCWRTDILVSLGSSIDRSMLDGLQRLKLVITAGDACAALDQAAALNNGVEVLFFANADCADPAEARDLCESIVRAIDYYIRERKE